MTSFSEAPGCGRHDSALEGDRDVFMTKAAQLSITELKDFGQAIHSPMLLAKILGQTAAAGGREGRGEGSEA